MTRLTRLFAFLVIVGVTVALRADDPPPASAEEQAIHEAAVKFVDAYNSKDAVAIAALFGPNARLEEPDGTVVEGKEEIQAGFAAAFEAEPDAQISVDMESIRIVTPDVAVEEGATEFFPDGETLTSRGRYVVVHLKKDGAWHMASVRSLEKEVVTNYEYLRQLEWLVGDWIDEDADSTVESTFHWEEGRNFLLQEFQVKRGTEVVQKGSQRIGWDPQAKQIRSWIFDLQGGFGESRWADTKDAWVVTSSGVSSEGSNVSGTRTMVPQGDRIHVRMSNRMNEGASQPDLEFTMVRRPPVPATAAAK